MSRHATDADRTTEEEERRDQLDVENDRLCAEVEKLKSAIRNISEGKFSTYKARNGRDVGIEADDGEMCFIVHSDLIHAAEVAAGIA